MKAVLRFTLPEEQEEFDDALQGSSYVSAIDEFLDDIRDRLKYGSFEPMEVCMLESTRDRLLEFLSIHGVER